MELEVEWDPAKAAEIWRRRRISLRDAATVFMDPLALTVVDEEHSTSEVRYATIGATETGALLIVVHADRGDRIRIITAWPATPAERRAYEARPQR